MKDNTLTYISINEALDQFQSQIKVKCPYAIETGLKAMDILTGGLFPGELCVIGARPAMGKSMFIFSIISYMVWKEIPIGLFSATDSMNVNFLSRLVSSVNNSEIPYSYEGKLRLLRDVVLDEVPLYLNCEPRMTILSLRENATKLKKEKGIKCLFVESIQALFDSEENGNTREGMERICREPKILAQELDIPIVVTSELNRSPEHREGIDGKCPQLCDLRSSSAIESNADKVLLLHRPEYYHITMDENGYDLRGIFIVIVAKNKYGSTGEVRLGFDPCKCRVIDVDGSVHDKEERDSKLKSLLEENETVQMLTDKLGLELDNKNNSPF